MEREILFRGKRIDNGEWVEGYYYANPLGAFILPKGYEISVTLDSIQVIPETIGQFTGLKDKNGKEIFEGDIIKQIYHPLGANPNAIEYYKIGVINWPFYIVWKIDGTTILDESLALSHQKTKREQYEHPTAGIDWIDKRECDYLYRDEIIGNIHDNPELLKQWNS